MPWYWVMQAIMKGIGIYASRKLGKYALEMAKLNKDLQMQSAENARTAGRIDEMLYEGDALMTQMDADSQALSYDKQANDTEIEGEEVSAEQRIAFVKNGVDLYGSPLLVSQKTLADSKAEAADLRALAESTRTMGAMKATSLRTRGRAAVLGAEINASSIEASAEMDYSAAEAKYISNMANTYLSSSNDMMSSWGQNSAQNMGSNAGHTSQYNGSSIRNEISNTNVQLSGSKARSLQSMYSGSFSPEASAERRS